MKKLLGVIMAVSLLAAGMVSLPACTKTGNTGSAENNGSKQSNEGMKKIGIVQVVEHPSLNTIRESFIKQLEDKGFKNGENITIDYQNAQGDQTNLKTISQKFVNGKYDLIVAIATPSAQVAAGETKDIPILFSACTDPVGSGLVASMNKPGKNVTGTSDAVSAERIMTLAKRITPDIKTIGALYNSSETNSIFVINELKEYAKKNGMAVVEATVTNSSDVQQAAQSLVGKADAIFSPIDNTVASAMPLVTQIANKAKKPVYVGADSMVKDGGLATWGINYPVLGKETADMAVEILNGKKAGDMPVKRMTDMSIFINKDTAKEIGITVPDDVMKEAAQVFGK